VIHHAQPLVYKQLEGALMSPIAGHNSMPNVGPNAVIQWLPDWLVELWLPNCVARNKEKEKKERKFHKFITEVWLLKPALIKRIQEMDQLLPGYVFPIYQPIKKKLQCIL
jgi:hypothetical protein